MEISAASEKKEVCRVLTGVLRRSPLVESLDPKTFYMMLSSNYPVLKRGDTFEFEPLWSALGGESNSEPMLGLFVAFSAACSELGLRPNPPQAVSKLNPAQQQDLMDRVMGGKKVNTQDLITEELPEEALDSGEAPAFLEAAELQRVVTEDLKRQITATVVKSIRSAPVGQYVDGGQLAFQIDSNFSDLCDGHYFNLEPIVDGLRSLAGYADRDIVVAIDRMERRLYKVGVQLRSPALQVSAAEQEELIEAGREEERQRQNEASATPRRSSSSAQTGTPQAADSGSHTLDQLIPPSNQGTAKERRLAKWGLKGFADSKAGKVRVAIMLAIGLGVGVYGFVDRPNRQLVASTFALPLKKAHLNEWSFQGLLDESSWYKLPPPKRKATFERFAAQLKARGWSSLAQVRDAQGRLLVVGRGPAIQAAHFLIYSPDGVKQPPPPPADPKNQLPEKKKE